MKKFRILVSALLVLSICLSFCGCGSSAAKYTVRYTDGSVHQLTSEKIIELYNQEPTRDNPTNVIEDAIISGTGTVTKFSCATNTDVWYGDHEYFEDQYIIEINNEITIMFTTHKVDGVKLKLYVDDKVDFVGKLSSANAHVTLYPVDGFVLEAGDSTGITLVK